MTPPLYEWLPQAMVGTTFLILGLVKVYGLSRCIMGGGDKPWTQRMCGSCPSWSRSANVAFVVLFLLIGVGELAWMAWVLIRGTTT